MTTQIIKDGIGHFDTVLSKLFLPTLDFWNNMGATPNTLTTFGLICSLLSIYYFYRNDSQKAIIFLILRCYFDYADGMLARKFKKVTTYGDLYDHLVDISYGVLFYVVIYLRSHEKFFLVGILTLFYGIFIVHMGCIESQYSKSNDIYSKNKTSISYLSRLSSGVNCDVMKFLDNSVLYVVMALIIVRVCRENNSFHRYPLKGIIMISRMM